jgi:hypothetical protein
MAGPQSVLLFLLSSLFILRIESSFLRNSYDSVSIREQNHPTSNATITSFPTLSDTIEMAALSKLIYHFHTSDYENATSSTVCNLINTRNITNPMYIPDGIHCHWYHHDWYTGAQVLLVQKKQSVASYSAVVFAGTDDLRTALTDAHLLMTEFGNAYQVPQPRYNISIHDQNRSDVRVHAGFNNAVFSDDLFGEIVDRLLLFFDPNSSDHRLFTTGHSLGAANAVLMALGLSQLFPKSHIRTINFGCPRMGNSAFRDYVHEILMASPEEEKKNQPRVDVWRFVLGWDLVPRLPELFAHAGHTVQLSYQKNSSILHPADPNPNETSAQCYYHHIGNETLHLAGVPFGWSAKPFIWIPGALWSHSIHRYYQFFQDWNASWIDHFETSPDEDPDNDDHPPNVDDDVYVNPPDENYMLDSLFTTAEQ